MHDEQSKTVQEFGSQTISTESHGNDRCQNNTFEKIDPDLKTGANLQCCCIFEVSFYLTLDLCEKRCCQDQIILTRHTLLCVVIMLVENEWEKLLCSSFTFVYK